LTPNVDKHENISCRFRRLVLPKFAKQLKTESKFDETIDVEKSRDLRLKFSRPGKNSGESAASRKITEVKREVMNVILPINEKQVLQDAPPSGIQ